MAIVNRTPDSFYDQGATYADDGRARPGRAGGRRGRRHRRHRRGQGRLRRRGRRRPRSSAGPPPSSSGPFGVPRPGDQRRHLASRGRARALPARRRPAQRHLGRRRPGRSRRSPPSSAPGWSAATPAGSRRAPTRTGPRTTTSSPTWSRRDRAGRAGGRRSAFERTGPDRPDPRLRQEHLPLARAHPPPRRARRDRLAGAGRAVQQGLRRRDARCADAGATARARWPRPRSPPGTALGCSARTRSPRPGRCSTWSPRSRAPGRRHAPCADSA